MSVKVNVLEERNILTKTAVLYDFLADAVDQINAVFSMQVKELCFSMKFPQSCSLYFQMIFVFLPALLLQVFTTYFVIKVFALKLTPETWIYFDFPLWILFLVFPTYLALYFGSATTNKGRKFCNKIGKYLSSCTDNENSQKVTNE